MALVLHRPRSLDPALALADTLAPFGEGMLDVLRGVDAAAREPVGAESRAALTKLAWEVPIGDARLVPLARAHAWLVRPGDLEGVATRAPASLGLDSASWRR